MTERADEFPFERYFSLAPLATYWRTVALTESGVRKDLAEQIVERLDAAPELLEPARDQAAIEAHRPLLDLTMSALFPTVAPEECFGAAILPFRFESVYETSEMRRLDLVRQFDRQIRQDAKLWRVGRTMSAYQYIVSEFYGQPMYDKFSMTAQIWDEDLGFDRYFKLFFDARFCTIEVRGDLPELTEDDLAGLISNRMDVAHWMSVLPPRHFEFHGFTVVQAVDVTHEQILGAMTRDLLRKEALTTPEHLDRLEERFRTLFRRPDLRMGVVSMEYGDFDVSTGMLAVGRSLLLSGGEAPECPSARSSLYARAAETRYPVVVHDLETYDRKTGFEWHLLQSLNMRNVVIAPLFDEDRLVGLLELASPEPGALHEFNVHPVLEVCGLLATALKRSLDDREDRVQTVIKENYTAIHPVVEWRFREVAQKYLLDQRRMTQAGEGEGQRTPPELQPIVFRDVIPLYGLSDIRGSSVQRQRAIQTDMVEQLGLALNIFVEAGTEQWLPALDELGYRIATFAQELNSTGLQSGDEPGVLEFLQQEVEPLLDQLAAFGDRTRERVEAYRAALDPELGVVYRSRRAFEESVNLINGTLSVFLERRQAEAQRMVPHYFEKFKTDGVDYNLYAGASLLRDGAFSDLHLDSLRLWQLMTMCGVVWELETLRPELELPLETTHLILVHSTPLAIRFRQDEKRFDVDGAYNIRYEIVKKRIDKAVVQGSTERLTQPGKIAIVYEHDRDAETYRRYIDYMQAANYLTDEVENLRLENLQGVYGLRALRVTVQDRAEDAMDDAPLTPRVESFVKGSLA